MGNGSSGGVWSRRKILVVVLASIGIFALAATTIAAVVMPFLVHQDDASSPTAVRPTTATSPAVHIAPLIVRPVETALVARPGQCAPAPPAPPTPAAPAAPAEPLRTCDVEQKAEYQLGPEALRLNLVGAISVRLPGTASYAVQLTMDPDSGTRFGQYTGTQLGKQVAFVRNGVVLAAPAINAPLGGQSLQLSGELTAATAEQIARMLREGV